MKTDRFDIHQHVTNNIISAIERGAGDFRLTSRRRQHPAPRQYCIEEGLSRRQYPCPLGDRR
jgi:hypothetical protein